MAENNRSSHDTSDVAKKRISPAIDPTAKRDSNAKKMRDLDRLLAQFENYFPGFTSAVLKITQNKR
jgi:hypothetical protein